MIRLRLASGWLRCAWAVLIALLLALRSLAPAGFMPTFDHGDLTIVACPGAMPAATHTHHPADHHSTNEQCPYASASALGALGPAWAPLPAPLPFGILLLAGETLQLLERQQHQTPPATGPPLPA